MRLLSSSQSQNSTSRVTQILPTSTIIDRACKSALIGRIPQKAVGFWNLNQEKSNHGRDTKQGRSESSSWSSCSSPCLRLRSVSPSSRRPPGVAGTRGVRATRRCLCASAPLQPSTSAPTAPLHLRLRPSHEVSLKIRGLDPSQLCTRCLCLAVNFPPGRGKPPSSSTQDSRLCELSRREETVGASAPLPPLPPSKAFFKFSERKRMFNEDPQYLCGLSRR